jgi:Ala-tRNA(Pro) deacylase
MKGKEEVLALLDTMGIRYQIKEHEPVYTIADMQQLGLDKAGKIPKNLFLRNANGKKHYLLVMENDRETDLGKMKDMIGATRLSFASEQRLEKYLGLTKGAVTPFGVLNDINREVQVIFDKDLKDHDIIGVHPNTNAATIYLSFEDLKSVVVKNGNEVSFI